MDKFVEILEYLISFEAVGFAKFFSVEMMTKLLKLLANDFLYFSELCPEHIHLLRSFLLFVFWFPKLNSISLVNAMVPIIGSFCDTGSI